MRLLIQRVTRGAVRIEGEAVGEIGAGIVILVGIARDDEPAVVAAMARKAAALRIFEDEAGRMNRSLLEVGGGALVVSQFTLHADTRRGRRPSFIRAAPPEHAAPLVDSFADALRALGVSPVATGRFGAMMAVEIHNQGPVTIWLDSDER